MAHPGTRRRARPLADLVGPALGKTLAARGFAAADIVTAWPEIVGARLAQTCEPIALRWPGGAEAVDREASATLVVRAERAFSLEVQHLAPVILERVNAYFGWRCAGKLTIQPGERRRPSPPRKEPRRDPKAAKKARAMAGVVADTPLREALTRLGENVFSVPPSTRT